MRGCSSCVIPPGSISELQNTGKLNITVQTRCAKNNSQYFVNHSSNLSITAYMWRALHNGYIHHSKHAESKPLAATQPMKPFAFAECQLHLNERSYILCDYKHWSSFGELSAVTLTMLISADALMTTDED